MPVDDPNNASVTLQASSSSSSQVPVLRADAQEFVPNQTTRTEGSKTKKPTGAIAKRPTNSAPQRNEYYEKETPRRHQPLPFRSQKKPNGDQFNSVRDGTVMPSVDSKKFYKDNQNNYKKTSRYDGPRNGYRSSNNNAGNPTQQQNRPRHRYDYDDQEEQLRKVSRDRPSYKRDTVQKTQKKSIEPSKISQREQLIKDIENNSLECMICCDLIKNHQPVWSCTNCFHILHLTCIKTWITNSKTESGEWRCVACQFLRLEPPRDYICFCGKQKYPAVNRNDLAHSCGEMCGRTDNCVDKVHKCYLLCHPGPHAICQSFVQRSCGCGKLMKTFQCSMKGSFECDSFCEKTLNCGLHQCKEKCHPDECQPCQEPIEMKCFCERKETKIELCSAETALITKYSCDKVCEKLLGCDLHRCHFRCHSHNCPECPLSPNLINSCPCGKTIIEEGQRTICTDPIICKKFSNVKCRCGRIEEKIACKDLIGTNVICKKKCGKFKSCGKHKCNQTCCIDPEHLCNQRCSRTLSCGKHKCPMPCHIGNCQNCSRVSFDELRCECGTSVVFPPVACGTKVPECLKPCARKRGCGHPVSHICHEGECPPCVYLTTKFCYGEHESRKTIPCNQLSFSCGHLCGKKLKCNLHSCIRQCHEGECEQATEVCKQPCTVKRDCRHNCNAPCHIGDCPDKPCKEKIEVTCLCGNLKEFKSCEQVSYENRKIQRVKLAMQMQDGEAVELKDIYGDLTKQTVKILECNYDCATLERNRRLDIAFKVENPNLILYPKFVPNYTDFIKTFYKKEPAFVKMVHEKLTELVKLSKESKQKSRSYSFPVMNRDKRHAVHDLAALFGVETQAYDSEPNRNVIATASRGSCWLPSMSLMELAQRETGLRQIRPPTMQTKK